MSDWIKDSCRLHRLNSGLKTLRPLVLFLTILWAPVFMMLLAHIF